MQQTKAIIFDLGGVLLDIDFKLSEKAFAKLGVTNFSDFFNQFHSNDLFRRLETGMDDQLFYDDLRAATGLSLTNVQIKDAWNALLLDFRPESVAVLPQLREKYDLYLLSNTNEIHLQEFQRRYEAWRPGQVFDDLFDAAYYSHRIGHRKPNSSAFEYVLEKHGLNATETIFIDDSINNIEAAQQLGLQTVHLKAGMKVEELGLMQDV
ncbi:HAD family hydrolase [Lacibacter sediminis]|uniref:HAD family phosphatase n=1 Tax=Lacibacter sediminis TaxID=2760713 RepID=A0A7G5XFE2_9BACT|nr:HAD family phosphatase [Lacibacter sediminis]QNA44195.1 HAD family phosphatase [Lacibacter sediminis]